VQARTRIAGLAVTGLATVTVALATATPAHADAPGPGHYCAKYNSVAVRTQPDGTARDNLAQGQTFQVQQVVSSQYTYGYKIVNGVHGYVLRSSLEPC
jgi:hypothetical protein